MLEIRGTDDDRIDIFPFVQFVVVSGRSDGFAGFFLYKSHCFISPSVPDIRHCRKLEIQFLTVVQHRRDKRGSATAGKTYNAYIDPVIGTKDSSITFGRKTDGSQGGQTRSGEG